VLELRSPEGAFERIEGYLRARGFFVEGGEDLVADLYLGYGLSKTIRRTGGASPPEPCPALPLAACSIRPDTYPVGHDENKKPLENHLGSAQGLGRWQPTWSEPDYAGAVERVRAAIERGDVYQVNLVQHLSAPFAGNPAGLAARLAPLRPRHPRPLSGDRWTIVSGSPELFLARRGDRIWTKPIKGTRPFDAADDLVERRLAGVSHLVSTVEGRLRPDVSLAEILEATFPGGSVTGAPKISAVDHIAALEPVGRGASMGAVGTLRPNGDFDLALTIRTFAVAAGRIHFWVGGGVVWDSDPTDEVEESWVKARPLLAAAGAPLPEPAHA
jgi:para-aminobenzoate synthetase component 1